MANPYVNKVVVDGVARLDLTEDTVTAADVLAGKTTHDASGAVITGTMTEHGTYSNSIITKAQSVSIPAGHYNGGSVSIASNQQALIVPGNIKHGVYILGVQGTYSGDPVTALYLYTEGVKNVAWGTNGTVSDGANYMQLSIDLSGYAGVICTTSPVSLAGYSTLKIDYNGPNGLSGSPTFGVNSVYDTSKNNPDTASQVLSASKARTIASLDVSNYTGSYYIKVFHAKNQTAATYLRVYRIWLE